MCGGRSTLRRGLLVTGGKNWSCAQNFNKTKYQGIWYEVAIYDPTQVGIAKGATSTTITSHDPLYASPLMRYGAAKDMPLCSVELDAVRQGRRVCGRLYVAMQPHKANDSAGTLTETPPTHISDSANCHGYKINIPLHGYTGTNASEPGNQREGFELWMTSPNMVFNLTISEGGEYEMAMVTIVLLQLPPTRTCVLASAQYSQHSMCAALSGLQLPWPSG